LALSVVKKPLIDGGIFSIVDLGLVGSAYFYGYALGKFLNGFLADYANIKRFFTFGLITSGAINISMGLNQSLTIMGCFLVFKWVGSGNRCSFMCNCFNKLVQPKRKRLVLWTMEHSSRYWRRAYIHWYSSPR